MTVQPAAPTDSSTTLYLLDGANLMFRAYHAIRSLTNSKGFPTNALYGFTAMLLKLLRTEHPDYVGIVFDAAGPTFRDHAFADYKANREEMPQDLRLQVPYIRKIAEGFRIPFVEQSGYEADDLIASLTQRAAAHGMNVCIVSSDKDLAQLVRPGVIMLDTMSDRRYDTAGVVEKWGVLPNQIRDYLALVGDSSDNIPGVAGIGSKTAVELLTQFGSLSAIYENLDKIAGKKREKLEAGRESAALSFSLVSLSTDIPVDDITWEQLHLDPPDKGLLTHLFQELEFKTFLREFHVEPTEAVGHRTIVRTAALLENAQMAILECSRAAISFAYSPPAPMNSEIHGIGFSIRGDDSALSGFYVPVPPVDSDNPTNPSREETLSALRTILANPKISKCVHDYKAHLVVASRNNLSIEGVQFDTMLASYLLDSGRYPHTLANIALDRLETKITPRDEIGGKGKTKIEMADLDQDTLGNLILNESDACLRLWEPMKSELDPQLLALHNDIELPLSETLAKVESHGILLDTSALEEMGKVLADQIAHLERDIFAMAGEEFMIGSPKQLSVVLFEKLGLSAQKRTKTGASTDSTVLEALADQHPICQRVLDWRSLTKLKSTYVDVLPQLVHPKTHRIHTELNQAVAATGRLSSSNPNLQNIPIRTEIGRAIRKAFIAQPGYTFLSADYSQIELRLLAHIADDKNLCLAFVQGADIHQRTASEVLGVLPEFVTKEMRRQAKAINFGILYGMGAFRLSRELGISRTEADRYISGYFARYPGVQRYLEDTVETARSTGEVRTLFGRKRRLPDITSPNHVVRAAAERMAVNTPIQGSAADLIKMAMLRLEERVRQQQLPANIVLQVHDELLLEVRLDALEPTKALVVDVMQNVVALKVPLVVDVHTGRTWSDAHG